MQPSTADINCIVETLRRNDYKASEIHRVIVNAWGEEIISDKRIRTITKEFRDGQRTQFSRVEGSGRKRNEERTELVAQVLEDVKEDNRITVRELSIKYDVTKDTMWRILKEDLNLKSKSLRWVPHELTDVQKEARVQCCEEMLTAHNARNTSRYTVVTDEKWFYEKPLGNTATRRCWVSPQGDVKRQTIAKRTQSSKKFHVMVAVTFSGMFHFKILAPGVTVNSAEYLQFLNEAMDSFDSYELQQQGKSIPWQYLRLQHDNARPHVSKETTQLGAYRIAM